MKSLLSLLRAIQYLMWMPKIWCFIFLAGECGSENTFNVGVTLCPFIVIFCFLFCLFFFSLSLHNVVTLMVHVRSPPVMPVRCLYVKPSLCFDKAVRRDCNIKPKLNGGKKLEKKRCSFFFAVNVCICFSCHCVLVTSCVSFKSYMFSSTCMLLCIYAIVAVVTMMVCGFRPDFTIKSVTQRNRQNKEKN